MPSEQGNRDAPLNHLVSPGVPVSTVGCYAWWCDAYLQVLREHSDAGLRSLGITVALNLGYSLLVKNIDNW
jgi:hypothetical protein